MAWRDGKGEAYRYCRRCHSGDVQRKWKQELVLPARLDWLNRYGGLPSSYDWSRTHASRRGGVALKRLNKGKWPSASVVGRLFGSWQEARSLAARAAPVSCARQVELAAHIASEDPESTRLDHGLRALAGKLAGVGGPWRKRM